MKKERLFYSDPNKTMMPKYQSALIYLFFISGMFSLISFFKVGSLNVTPPFLVSVVYVLVSLLGFALGQIVLSKRRVLLFVELVIVLSVSFVFNDYGKNLNSFLLYIYYFSLFLLLDQRKINLNFHKGVFIFSVLMAIFSLYGLYQFAANNLILGLPFKEIIPKSLWVDDMNTVTIVYGRQLFGRTITRSHSIFAEPSTLSQFAAIGILLVTMIRERLGNVIYVILAGSMGLGLVSSLSGSGLIILIIGAVYCLLTAKRNIQRDAMIFILVGIPLILSVTDKDIVAYYLSRITEVGSGKGSYTSGYYRFVLPFEIGSTNLMDHFLGYGPGNDDIIYNLMELKESSIPNGFGKIFVELGPIGLLSMIYLFVIMYPHKECENHRLVMILFIITVCLNFVGTFMSPTIWPTALLAFGANQKERKRQVKVNEECAPIHG